LPGLCAFLVAIAALSAMLYVTSRPGGDAGVVSEYVFPEGIAVKIASGTPELAQK
jgi:hypothetical protein